jgi:hypothetical protein
MAAGTAMAAAGRVASGGGITGAIGGLLGRKRGSKGSRIKSLESRVEALEGANSEMEAEAPVAGAVGNAAQAAETAATAQVMGGDATSSMGGVMADKSSLIPTGRFSEQAQNTANSVFGTEEARNASISQIPAGVASDNQETVGAIADLMNENV